MSAEEAEDYREIIRHPMDFTTMQRKFRSSQYCSISDFLEDIKLIFNNAEEYNQPSSNVLTCKARTEETFIELLQKSLPGANYLRRRLRKRMPTPSEENEAEVVEEIQNGKHASSRQKDDDDAADDDEDDDDDEEYSSQRKTKQSGGRENQSDSEEDEDEEDTRRKSKRTSRKDYREQDSDNDRDARRTGLRRPARAVTYDKEASSDEDSAAQRHSKRQKRS